VLRPRIIPSLLVHKGGLVKTVAFGAAKYVGDPINAVKIFNEKEADELTVFDIDATRNGVEPDYQMIAHLAAECRMPLCYGGGVRTVEQVKRINGLGVEKVAISAAAINDPEVVQRMAEAVGRQSVVVVLDVRAKTGLWGKGYELSTHNSTQRHKLDPIAFAVQMAKAGAGELVINSVDRDGQMKGYDLPLAQQVRASVNIPLTFLGGAGSHEHIRDLFSTCGVVGAAVGSLFVFKGPYKAVLINYPTAEQKDAMCAVARSAEQKKTEGV
jgi:imidazole glycerol-phosphate synthase subunit HisF